MQDEQQQQEHGDSQQASQAEKRERQDLTGSIFKNDRKTKDSHPDFTGSVTVHDQEFWLSGWRKTSRNDEPYISISLKPKAEAEKSKLADDIL